MIKLALLGSTGSVGTQTLDVVRRYKKDIEIKLLGASKPSDILKNQVLEFKPPYVYIEDFKEKEFYGSKVINGDISESIIDIDTDLFINAVAGINGIKPTYLILKAGKKLATANKESIICLGEMLREDISKVIPIDSEHSAIYQILKDLDLSSIKKITLTASGGPFFNKPLSDFAHIRVEDALSHPKWSMGKKITIDSATMLNKGFEVIEAHYLFNIPYEKIDIIIHPESIIHGMVEFTDTTVISNMSNPDMRIPISYAIFGERKEVATKVLNLWEIGSLNFYKPDFEKFPLLRLSIECGKKGGVYPIALTVADEIAVNLFLDEKIGFVDIYRFIDNILQNIDAQPPKDLDSLFEFINCIKKDYTLKYFA